MTRGRIGSLVTVAAFFGLIGCQGVQPQASSAKRCAVTLHGCGHAGTRVAVSADRRTLRDALAGVAVDPVTNAGGYPVLVFAHLAKPGADYYVPTELIDETALGDILLDPGERIELVPWTGTDLFRGLKEVAPPRVTPSPEYVSSLQPVYDWYLTLPNVNPVLPETQKGFGSLDLDLQLQILNGLLGGISGVEVPSRPEEVRSWVVRFATEASRLATLERPAFVYQADLPYLNRLYSSRINGDQPFDIPFTPVDERGQINPTSMVATVTPEMLKSQALSRELPKVSKVTLILFGKESIPMVERVVEGRSATFFLPRPYTMDNPGQSQNANLPVRADALDYALLFDGDTVTVTPPENVPLVVASQAVSRHVLSPAVASRKLAGRLAP